MAKKRRPSGSGGAKTKAAPTAPAPAAVRPRRSLVELALWAGFALIVLLSLCPWDSGGVPGGLYIDETANLNDLRFMLEHGHDQWGAPFPLYFRSVDDYKNPVYLYLALPWAWVFGANPVSMRIFSVLMIALAALIFRLLARHYGWSRRLALIGMILFFLSPSLLTVKRLIFAVNALVLTLTLAWYLWVRAVDRPSARAFILAGLAWGLFTYSYTGARFMSVLLTGFLVAVTWMRGGEYRRGAVAAVGAYAVALVPLGVFALANPGFFAARLNMVSVWARDGFAAFLWKAPLAYVEIVGWFTWFDGDANLRHQFGPGGISYLAFLPLVAVGLWCAARRFRDVKHVALVWAFLVFPLPAVVTIEPLHNLRTLHVLPVLVLLAGEGARFLLRRGGGKPTAGDPAEASAAAVAGRGSRVAGSRVAQVCLALALLQGVGLLGYYAAAYATRAHPYFCGGAIDAIERARRVAAGRPLTVHANVFTDNEGVLDRPQYQMLYAFNLHRRDATLRFSRAEDKSLGHVFSAHIRYRRGTLLLLMDPDMLDKEKFWGVMDEDLRVAYRVDRNQYRLIDEWPAGPRGPEGVAATFRLYEKLR